LVDEEEGRGAFSGAQRTAAPQPITRTTLVGKNRLREEAADGIYEKKYFNVHGASVAQS
jgi:hypothetical protein